MLIKVVGCRYLLLFSYSIEAFSRTRKYIPSLTRFSVLQSFRARGKRAFGKRETSQTTT